MSGSSRYRLAGPNGDDPPPSLQLHYRGFIATTRQFTPLRRIGTFGLAVGTACAVPLASSARSSRSLPKPDRASRCLHAGCRSVDIMTSSELIPQEGSPRGFDIAYSAFDAAQAVRLRLPPRSCPPGSWT